MINVSRKKSNRLMSLPAGQEYWIFVLEFCNFDITFWYCDYVADYSFILACNGGVQQFPSIEPTVSLPPSLTPTLSNSPAYCIDRPGWYDSVGWTCALYESIEKACLDYGDSDAGDAGLQLTKNVAVSCICAYGLQFKLDYFLNILFTTVCVEESGSSPSIGGKLTLFPSQSPSLSPSKEGHLTSYPSKYPSIASTTPSATANFTFAPVVSTTSMTPMASPYMPNSCYIMKFSRMHTVVHCCSRVNDFYYPDCHILIYNFVFVAFSQMDGMQWWPLYFKIFMCHFQLDHYVLKYSYHYCNNEGNHY